MNSTNYKPHIFALCSLFVVGNIFITNSFFAHGIWHALYCVACLLILLFLMTFFVTMSQKSKLIFYFTIILAYPAAILGAVFTFLDFLIFLNAVQMPQTNIFVLSFVMIVVIVVFLLSNISAAYKYYLLVGVVGAVFFIICLISGIKNIDFNNSTFLFEKNVFSTNDFFKNFLPVVVIPPFIVFNFKTPPIKSMLCGVLTGCFSLLLCFLQSRLSLGLVNDVEFPFLTSVGIISTGSLFTRLDGLVYFLFFVTSLTKITICLKTMIFVIPNKIKNTH